MIKIYFSCKNDKPEQQVLIVGSDPSIGSWNISAALLLQGSPYAIGFIKVAVPIKLEFKAVIKSGSSYTWEFVNSSINRSVTASKNTDLYIQLEFNKALMELSVNKSTGQTSNVRTILLSR